MNVSYELVTDQRTVMIKRLSSQVVSAGSVLWKARLDGQSEVELKVLRAPPLRVNVFTMSSEAWESVLVEICCYVTCHVFNNCLLVHREFLSFDVLDPHRDEPHISNSVDNMNQNRTRTSPISKLMRRCEPARRETTLPNDPERRLCLQKKTHVHKYCHTNPTIQEFILKSIFNSSIHLWDESKIIKLTPIQNYMIMIKVGELERD